MRQADLVVGDRVADQRPRRVFQRHAGDRRRRGQRGGDRRRRAPTSPMPRRKIARSKTFDNATSCSSENSVIVVARGLRRRCSRRWRRQAACCSTRPRRRTLQAAMFPGGKLAPAVTAQSADEDRGAGRARAPRARATRFLMVEETGTRAAAIRSRARSSRRCWRSTARAISPRRCELRCAHLRLPGRRALGRHPHARRRAACVELGLELPVCRVIVNQAHASPPAAASTTGCRSRCRWAAAPGAATASRTT